MWCDYISTRTSLFSYTLFCTFTFSQSRCVTSAARFSWASLFVVVVVIAYHFTFVDWHCLLLQRAVQLFFYHFESVFPSMYCIVNYELNKDIIKLWTSWYFKFLQLLILQFIVDFTVWREWRIAFIAFASNHNFVMHFANGLSLYCHWNDVNFRTTHAIGRERLMLRATFFAHRN